jgi:hypothetical protein
MGNKFIRDFSAPSAANVAIEPMLSMGTLILSLSQR